MTPNLSLQCIFTFHKFRVSNMTRHWKTAEGWQGVQGQYLIPTLVQLGGPVPTTHLNRVLLAVVEMGCFICQKGGALMAPSAVYICFSMRIIPFGGAVDTQHGNIYKYIICKYTLCINNCLNMKICILSQQWNLPFLINALKPIAVLHCRREKNLIISWNVAT